MIGTHGPGGKPSIEPYPFAGLDLGTRAYPKTGNSARVSLDVKYPSVTPFGTPVAQLVRTGGEMLVAPCGNCGLGIGKCRCDYRAASE